MKRALLGLCVVLIGGLAACAPPATVTGGGASAVANASDPGHASLSALWGQDSGLTFTAGSLDALDLKLVLSGTSLKVNAPSWCVVDRQDIVCTVKLLPAGKNFVLPMRGSNLSAVATYKRASGLSYSTQVRQ